MLCMKLCRAQQMWWNMIWSFDIIALIPSLFDYDSITGEIA